MNKIYKVIWSNVKHCYVVVSEIARNHGKEHSSRKRTARGVCGTVLALVLGLSVPFTALAADPVDLGNGGTASYDSQGNLTVGNQVSGAGDKNAGRNNTAIGTNSDTLRNGKDGETEKNGQPLDTDSNSKLVDGEGTAHSLDLSTESGGSTAVGYNNRSEGDRSTAIGNSAKITNKPITYYADADGNKTTSADAAAWYKGADGKPTLVPQVFRDADGNMTATPQYVHTYTEKDAATGEEITKTEITSDATLADQKDGKPVYNYLKSDNTDHLYSVTLYQAADNSIAAGTDVTANGSNAVAVGYNSTADNSAVAMGDTASASENAVAIGKNATASVEGAIALGKDSQGDRAGGVTGWDPKTGTTSTSSSLEWQSTDGALSVGSGTASRQITGVAAGSEDSDAVNLAQLKKAMTHYYSVKTTETTDQAGHNNYLNDGATGDNALAAGVSAVASGKSATAVGNQTVASGANASAYGYRSVASGSDSVAIGSGTSAQKDGAIAIGGHAMGVNAVQVGTGSTAQSKNAVAIGGHAKGENSVEVGSGATAQGAYSTSIGGHAIGANSIAIGSHNDYGYNNPASAAGRNSIAIGGHTNGDNNIAIGAGSATSSYQAITVGGSASGQQAVSVGNSANATAGQATAIGYGSAATWSQSTAVGGHATGISATAVGQGSNATSGNATAVGTGAEAGGQYSTALGYGTSSNGTYTTAIGGASASGTNVTAIGKSSTAGGYGYISDATAIGGAHVSSSYATAIGSNATVNGQYGVALGQNSNVSDSSTGVGANSKATNTGTAVGYGAQAYGSQSAAVGGGSMASGTRAVSLGGGGAWGDYSIALGSGAGTSTDGIAIGKSSGAWGTDAIAIGTGSNAWRANSIVLGKNSKSGADKNIEGYDPRTGVASVDASAAWYSTDEAVSIGRAEEKDAEGNVRAAAITRQLSNVAAGTLDTDAVNVAQLKAAAQKINMHDYSVYSPDTETDTNYTNGGAVAKNSMAAGVSASTSENAENAVAIGYKAKADGYGATVIGQYGTATGRYALAFGGQQTDTTAETANNLASGDNAVAFGERTVASGNNSTAFGQGTQATEERATAFGQRTAATSSNATAFGIDTTASGQSSTAFGNLTQATAIGATAFGNKNQATGQYATAWGGGDKVVTNTDGTTTKVGTVASGLYATAFGERTAASGESATAFGSDSTASGKNALAFGENSTAAAENSLAALGGSTAETAKNSAAIGNGAEAKLADSVALGSKSVASRAKYSDLTSEAEKAAYGKGSSSGSAWEATDNAIAVGNDSTVTRQITGVAAGSLDTDAVNVAQLKASGFKVTTQNDGTISSSILNGDTLDFEGKDNAIVSTTKDSKTITVAVSRTPTFDSATFGTTGNEKVTIANGQISAYNDQQQKRAAVGVDNQGNGTLFLVNDDLSQAHLYTQSSKAAGNDGITRMYYVASTEGNGGEVNGIHTIAVLDDGINYAGDNYTDDSKTDKVVVKHKLNSTMDITGGADTDNLSDGNIGVVAVPAEEDENGNVTKRASLEIKLNKDLTGLTSVTAGNVRMGSHPADTLKLIRNGSATGEYADAGNYTTGLDNKEWNVKDPTYVSGRAATEDQLKAVSDAVNNAAETAGRHTVVTVNDKANATTAAAGTGEYGEYAGTSDGNLLIAAKNDNGQMTYNIKLNDQLAIGQKGADGKDGKVTVETKDGTRVVIGHDGKDGDDGKDGLFVRGEDGADGKSGVSITGPNGQDGSDGKVGIAGKDGKDAVSLSGKDGAGHIGLTGPKGENGRDGASIDIQTDYGDKTLDDSKNITVDGEEKASRLIYTDAKGSHQVATMDDGLKFVGNDGKEVVRKLNTTLSVTGGLDKDAVQAASTKNLGVRSNEAGDGLEIVMTDTPDFAKVTIGTGTGSSGKIILGEQTVTGKKADGTPSDTAQTGNYITGLDNKAWDKDNIVEDRAATEGQLRDVAASITDEAKGGGFGLADEKGNAVKKDLGQTVMVKGDGKNIETKVDGGALEVSLKKDVDLGKDGSIKAGDTTINKDGVDTNKITIKDSSISIDKDGINAGNTQITNMASGASAITADENGNKKYEYNVDSNGANIGDVKQIASDEAGKAAEAVKAKSGKNITVKDDHTVNLNDHITLGDDTDTAKQVDIDGKAAKVTAGSGENQVTVDGSKGQVTVGSGDSAVTLGRQANTAGDSNPAEGRYLNGLDNKSWDGSNIQSGRAATEDQLKTVSDKVNSGRVFQGDDGKSVTVGMGETLKLQGGASEVSDANNIGIVKGADDTLNVRLAKDLTGLSSVTTGNTTINNSGLTVKGGNSHQDITIQQGSVSMGGNQIHDVAPGTAPTDAVNVSQLQQTGRAINQLGSSLDKLGTRVDRVGANSAALAALHPLDFDPDDKLDFAVGAGNYSGANAVALGAFYRPNEDVMFSLGGSTGGGENMINVGATFKIGQHNHVSNSRVAMAKEIRDLKALVARQDSEMQQMKNMMNQLAGKTVMTVDRNVLFPDIPENHWAYEYVTKLAKAGIVEGYEDGEFKGNRMMSRYEFAALVYRAIMAGAASNPELNKDGTLGKLAKEFSGELQYITIAVVDKDKNGKPTIERVRTVEDDARHHSK